MQLSLKMATALSITDPELKYGIVVAESSPERALSSNRSFFFKTAMQLGER